MLCFKTNKQKTVALNPFVASKAWHVGLEKKGHFVPVKQHTL